ncbi:MAG: hypothetical protein CME64_07705 [Halobacteriovoraceae bacterium]|nr:hypothetical protein [Halobacteriovoraceae bacterium]
MNSQLNKTLATYFVTFYLASFLTFQLAESFAMSSILSACLVTLLVCSAPWIKKAKLEALVYCASFAGMCSPSLDLGPLGFVGISFIGSCLFLLLKNQFIGLGGKLGTMAFLSCALFVLMRQLYV